MKIALIQCPVWGTYDPPYALAQLSSCLKKECHEVFLLDLNIRLYNSRTENYKHMWAWEQSLFWYDNNNVDKFFADNKSIIEKNINEIINANAKIVGFSVNAASRIASLKFAKMIKSVNRDITVVFGGPLFFKKRFINDILSNNVVDIVIPGEGEASLLELVYFLKSGKDISLCRGICFRKGEEIVDTGERPLITGLDTLPFLDFSDLPLLDYDDSRHIVFMASRGCIQRCVFCSSRGFWPKFRTMSGKRIFEEIKFHKKQEGELNPYLGHIDFLDLVFNGNIEYLIEFCDLIIEAQLDIYWSANMIIRPEMTRNVIKKMKDSGCEHIIFGIESGSQRVLDLMKKNYSLEVADRIIKDMHEQGIIVTANFMFGFPGETEDDFKLTLDFIRRNHKYLDRVYPSRTYCAIEEFSYLADNLETFGIKVNPPNHLFWESDDGRNTYPERLRRCNEFSRLAASLGIEVGCGVQTSVQLDEFFNLFEYYEFKKDYKKALEYLLKYFTLEPFNQVVKNKLIDYFAGINGQKISICNNNLLKELTLAVYSIQFKENIYKNEIIVNWVDSRERSFILLQAEKEYNSKLNDREFVARETILKSRPKIVTLQISGPREYEWVFGQQEKDYELFDLNTYRARFENKISSDLSKAEKIIFKGSGDIMLLPNFKDIIDYFDKITPHVSKEFFTEGLGFSFRDCEMLVSCKSNCIINVSLHASNSQIYTLLSRNGNFDNIIRHLKYLLKIRKEKEKPRIHLNFAASTLNIEDLPNFIRFAAGLGVDKIKCYYSNVCMSTQSHHSCYFQQGLTNRALNEAKDIAQKLNMDIDLPPRFGEDYSTTLNICDVPWREILIGFKGDVEPCETLNDCNESLEINSFSDVWNSSYYQSLREALVTRGCPGLTRCLRLNPVAVNNFSTHIVSHKTGNKAEVCWEEEL